MNKWELSEVWELLTEYKMMVLEQVKLHNSAWYAKTLETKVAQIDSSISSVEYAINHESNK